METIFGIHHDTASLREKNDIIQKSKSKDVILDGVNEKNEKNIIKKPSVDKSLDKFNNNNPTTTLQSLLRFAKSPTLSPHSTPHSTPPTSRPGTPFDEMTVEKMMLGNNLNYPNVTADCNKEHQVAKKFQNQCNIRGCNSHTHLSKLESALKFGGAAFVAAFMAPYIVAGVVSAIGFEAGGIAVGSFAAWIMSLYNGAVTSGSVCAILQSIGAAGLGTVGTIASGITGAVMGGGISMGLEKFYEESKLSESEESSLEEYLKISQSSPFFGSSTITFDFNTLIRQNEEYVDKFLDVLIVVAPFTNLNKFKVNNCGNSCLRVLEKLSKTYGDSRVDHISNFRGVQAIDLDISTFEHPQVLQNIIKAEEKELNGLEMGVPINEKSFFR
nr:13645_t:CDS:2 [Entrophospora candida]